MADFVLGHEVKADSSFGKSGYVILREHFYIICSLYTWGIADIFSGCFQYFLHRCCKVGPTRGHIHNLYTIYIVFKLWTIPARCIGDNMFQPSINLGRWFQLFGMFLFPIKGRAWNKSYSQCFQYLYQIGVFSQRLCPGFWSHICVRDNNCRCDNYGR